MKIQIDGTNVKNKGAELMLYCVLEQIEKSYPDATVFWNDDSMMGTASSIETPLELKKSGWQNFAKVVSPFKVQGILRRLGLPHRFLTRLHALPGLDLVLDASGFHYSDQFDIRPEYVANKRKYYRELRDKDTKLIFLPQAFGPFTTSEGKELAQLVVEYGELVFARDKISYGYLASAVSNGSDKILEYPDITVMSSYEVPFEFEHLAGRICIIPNKRMVDKSGLTLDNYVQFLLRILERFDHDGEKVFLLNHEGAEDLQLCEQIQKSCPFEVDVVSGLNAKKIKGLISISKFVISSRFHGVASALSTNVPCLATSWSHKYEQLFKTFNLNDRLLDVGDIDGSMAKIEKSLEQSEYQNTRKVLDQASKNIKKKNVEMWNMVWRAADFKS